MSAAPKSAAQAVRGDSSVGDEDDTAPVKLITVEEALDDLGELASLPVIATPFPTLNEAIGYGGLVATQAYQVPGGTGRGKTSFIGNIAVHVAAETDVLIATWEMRPGHYVARAAAAKLGVASNTLVREAKHYAGAILGAVPRRIKFLHRPTLKTVKRAADQLAQASGRAPLVITDYVQKIAEQIMATQARPDARLATAQTSAELLEIAEDARCPVLAVNATSRASGRRTLDPRSVAPYELVDVARESGGVEFDSAAMIVLSLSEDHEGDERIGTITVAKARYGTECHIDARYHGARGSWRDCGRVERATEGALRSVILDALNEPAKSKSEIQRRTKRNKTAVLREIDAMVSAGVIAIDRDGYRRAT